MYTEVQCVDVVVIIKLGFYCQICLKNGGIQAMFLYGEIDQTYYNGLI